MKKISISFRDEEEQKSPRQVSFVPAQSFRRARRHSRPSATWGGGIPSICRSVAFRPARVCPVSRALNQWEMFCRPIR